ncbi:hypothetical protein JGU71_23195 [Antrihabitans sp. YC3-6]|uniref:Secreted protein n=1 Tax=Antrihabitans stalagmiti TaxID=2799499 RepID=A0A934NV68_9NOCA|nr:hypothetical protein [Antrihabitans stalagmiti]MBJ8341797.1 hypothetical protein [Antrihabitans stalagmiti]
MRTLNVAATATALFIGATVSGGLGQATASPSLTQAPPPVPGAIGDVCSHHARVGVDTSTGKQIVCTYMGDRGGWKWVGTVPLIGENEIGTPCSYPSEVGSQTSEGFAVQCDPSSDTWQDGP